MIITTETGSVYNLSGAFCIRNGEFQFKKGWAYCIDLGDGMTMAELPQPFDDADADRRLPLQVGKRMYVGGMGGWWLSTRIVSIEGEQDG